MMPSASYYFVTPLTVLGRVVRLSYKPSAAFHLRKVQMFELDTTGTT
jgi:hypothetical protein